MQSLVVKSILHQVVVATPVARARGDVTLISGENHVVSRKAIRVRP